MQKCLEEVKMMIRDEDRNTVLLALYQQTNQEITRYRDYEWKMVVWTIVLMAGVVTAVRTMTTVPSSHKISIQILLCLFTGVAAIYGIWHIRFIHIQLIWNRILRRKIERVLEFYEEGAYLQQDSILPSSWANEEPKFWEAKTHLWSWFILVGCITLYTIYCIVYQF